MKKFLFLAIVMIAFVSCSKNLPNDSTNPVLKPVNAIAGSFVAQDGDITLKSAEFAVTTRTWTMYARKSIHYGGVDFAEVKGLEFITGSPAQIWWATPDNNPVTFTPQDVYSNLTPMEDLRVIEEGKVGTDLVYLGMLDFNPKVANFPLVVNGYRLGDKLTINTGNLTTILGGNLLTASVSFKAKPIDLVATKIAALTGNHAVPNGKQFQWSDIVYGTAVDVTPFALVGSTDNIAFSSFTEKIEGDIVISLSFNGGPTLVLPAVQAQGAGKALRINLSTTKVGWVDSVVPLSIEDFDIKEVVTNITIN